MQGRLLSSPLCTRDYTQEKPDHCIDEGRHLIYGIESYWLSVRTNPDTLITFVTDFFAPGTTVHATISLNEVNTLFFGNDPDVLEFSALAFIDSWTVYQADGTESAPMSGPFSLTQNAIRVDNCARITFFLYGAFVSATAQVNIFTL